eukprot:3940434-Rhodomonas_salina.1
MRELGLVRRHPVARGPVAAAAAVYGGSAAVYGRSAAVYGGGCSASRCTRARAEDARCSEGGPAKGGWDAEPRALEGVARVCVGSARLRSTARVGSYRASYCMRCRLYRTSYSARVGSTGHRVGSA